MTNKMYLRVVAGILWAIGMWLCYRFSVNYKDRQDPEYKFIEVPRWASVLFGRPKLDDRVELVAMLGQLGTMLQLGFLVIAVLAQLDILLLTRLYVGWFAVVLFVTFGIRMTIGLVHKRRRKEPDS